MVSSAFFIWLAVFIWLTGVIVLTAALNEGSLLA